VPSFIVTDVVANSSRQAILRFTQNAAKPTTMASSFLLLPSPPSFLRFTQNAAKPTTMAFLLPSPPSFLLPGWT
jgi:hypothetical protein